MEAGKMEWLIVGDTKEVQTTHENISALVKSFRNVEQTLKVIAQNDREPVTGIPSINICPKSPEEKVSVNVHSRIIKIANINVTRQEVDMDLMLSLSWNDKTLNGMKADDITWYDRWNPLPTISNAVSTYQMDKNYFMVSESSPGQDAVAGMRIRFKGTLVSKMNLSNFPFDKQDLTIQLSSDLYSSEVQFQKHSMVKNSMVADSFTGNQEWKLYNHIISSCGLGERRNPVFEITVNVQRISRPYVWHGMVVPFLLTALSFSTFVVDSDLPAERIIFRVLLLLGVMIVKRTVVLKCPQRVTSTFMDKYILCNILLLWLFVVEIPIETFIHQSDGNNKHLFQLICVYLLLAAFVILNLVFLIIGIFLVLNTTRKLKAYSRNIKLLSAIKNGKDNLARVADDNGIANSNV